MRSNEHKKIWPVQTHSYWIFNNMWDQNNCNAFTIFNYKYIKSHNIYDVHYEVFSQAEKHVLYLECKYFNY